MKMLKSKFLFSKSKKKKKKQRRNNKDETSSDDDLEEMKKQLEEDLSQTDTNPADKEEKTDEDQISTVPTITLHTKSKAKASKEVANGNEQESQEPVILQCFVCKEEFPSRNALFKHIKESNHAKPIQVKAEVKTKTKQKRK